MGEIWGQKSSILGLELQKSVIDSMKNYIFPDISIIMARKAYFDLLLHNLDCLRTFHTLLRAIIGEIWGKKSSILGLELQKSVNNLPKSYICPHISMIMAR